MGGLTFCTMYLYLCIGFNAPTREEVPLATAKAVISGTFQDEKGERVSLPLYISVDDTGTLASLVTLAKTVMGTAEAISDSELIRLRFIVETDLPAGIKSAPVVGSDNEETGLFTMSLVSPSTKSFGVDVPAIAQTVLDADNPNLIDLTNADVTDFVDNLTAGALQNNLWSTALGEVRAAIKTFRSHRRAAKRTR
jgi:hypothetical protein